MKNNFRRISFPLLIIAIVYCKANNEIFLGLVVAIELLAQGILSILEAFKK